MRFCQAFMLELHRNIGEDCDVPPATSVWVAVKWATCSVPIRNIRANSRACSPAKAVNSAEASFVPKQRAMVMSIS